jgi:peptidyl-prolyl cis-trans isomerase SurA
MTCFLRFLLIPCVVLSMAAASQARELGPRFDERDVIAGSDAQTSPKNKSQKDTQPLLDKIIAVVNNEVITRVELDDRTETLYKQFVQKSGQTPDKEALRKQVLERLITDKVLIQYGRESGLRIDDGMVDGAIGRIAEDNKLDLASFKTKLQQEGIEWSKFREEIRKEILYARLRDREIDSKMVVTDAEVDVQLRAESAAGGNEEELLLSHLLVSIPEQADPEQIARREARAKQAMDKLKAGQSFAQVAASFSDASDALQGGSLGWRPMSRIPSLFSSLAQGMKPGEISSIIRAGNGFHIFQVVERRGSKVSQIVKQYHLREILIRLTASVTENDARAKLAGLRARWQAGEDFQLLAKLNSEDENRSKGGDIGWVSQGESFPEFDKIMIALKPGEVSEAVRTQMGLHLLQLVEFRENEVGEERRRLAAKQGVRARKVDEAFDDWIRQQRDSAFVEYREKSLQP